MFKILKNKKGMTLMELIVGLLLLSIVVTAAGASLAPMLKVYAKANDIAEWNTLLDTIANHMISDMAEMTVPPATMRDDEIAFTAGLNDISYSVDANSGVLLKSVNDSVPKAVLTEGYYKRKSVSFSCASAGGTSTAYILTITIASESSTETISRDYAVRPLALNPFI